MKNSQEAIVVNAFSTLKLLMMLRRKIRHELWLEDELYLKKGSSVVALVTIVRGVMVSVITIMRVQLLQENRLT
jgi:hypothetical protein